MYSNSGIFSYLHVKNRIFAKPLSAFNFKAFREWTKRYGKVYGIQEGWKNILVVSDTEMLQEMFTKKFEYFHGRKVEIFYERLFYPNFNQQVNPLQGNIDTEPRVNAFSARGQRWKRLRAVANPVFSVNNLKKVKIALFSMSKYNSFLTFR